MARRRSGRPVDGVLLLDKPAGLSSNRALQEAKRLLFAAKAGHTGSLDPLATGLLPLCFGEATKFSGVLLNADKQYQSTFALGVATATGDADGDILDTRSAIGLTRSRVTDALDAFVGDILQVPSMYSALKHRGQPLYKLARQGLEIEREARPVTVFNIRVLEFRPTESPQTPAELDLAVHCSKGTYIRSIAEDLGRALGCGAHVKTLRRTGVGVFDLAGAVTLEQLTAERGQARAEVLDHHLLPVDTLVADLPELWLPQNSAHYFRLGNPVMDPQVYRLGREGDMVRVFAPGEPPAFLGLGVLDGEGRVAPKRLVAQR